MITDIDKIFAEGYDRGHRSQLWVFFWNWNWLFKNANYTFHSAYKPKTVFFWVTLFLFNFFSGAFRATKEITRNRTILRYIKGARPKLDVISTRPTRTRSNFNPPDPNPAYSKIFETCPTRTRCYVNPPDPNPAYSKIFETRPTRTGGFRVRVGLPDFFGQPAHL